MWLRKKNDKLKSEEYLEIIQKFSRLVGDVDVLGGRVVICLEDYKKLRAEIGALKREKILKTESDLNEDGQKYL